MSGPAGSDEVSRRAGILAAIDELDARLDEHRPTDDRGLLVRSVAALYRELDRDLDR